MEKTVAVIGAGASGLPSIKACKEEGINVVCYEQTDSIGGLWRYREEVLEGVATVMKSTVINSSKEISAFSDFPPPETFPNYMHYTVFLRYLEMYAEKFELISYIKFQHRVISVVPSDDYDSSGKWLVTVKNLVTDKISRIVYDGVMAATGHQAYPLRPRFQGEETFLGSIIHSHSYRTAKGYEDKRVMIVGVGNSGGDLAVELSTISRTVYLSTRRGCWVLHRIGENGRPFDLDHLNRVVNCILHVIPYWFACWLGERAVTRKFDHSLYQLKPKHRIFSQHPMVNDALPNKILSGTVVIKGAIKRFVERGVIFEGEDSVTELDAVILATGYEIKFPYISEEIVDCTIVDLYKFIFPPQLNHATLGIIGLIQPIGGLFPISEIQARWVVQVIKGKISLPSVDVMYQNIKETRDAMRKRYFSGSRHRVQVDYIDYIDDIASKIGAKPNFLRMFFEDPRLFLTCITGPSLPYQYRLQGPHIWSGAREAILNCERRLLTPLQTRADVSETESPVSVTYGYLGFLMQKLYKILKVW